MNVARNHPASTAQVSVGAVVGAAVLLFGIDLPPDQLSALIVLVSAVAPGVSWLAARLAR